MKKKLSLETITIQDTYLETTTNTQIDFQSTLENVNQKVEFIPGLVDTELQTNETLQNKRFLN